MATMISGALLLFLLASALLVGLVNREMKVEIRGRLQANG
jgi:hypothetical protein